MKLRNKKTGEIEYLIFSSYPVSGDIVLEYVDDSAESGYSEYCRYSSLAKLNEEWEDYTQTEPLIKDEKIRNAVRAWWECCQEGIDDKRVYIKDAEFKMGIYRLDLGRYYFFDDKKEGFYTIAELCGEEEAPEPLEPSFIDLDERIREKEEE